MGVITKELHPSSHSPSGSAPHPATPLFLLPAMASNVFGAKRFVPTPPDKGSFPLDHDGECKEFYLRYMVCLANNEHRNSACR